MLTPEQINSLLEIIDSNQSIMFAKHFGTEFLSTYDKSLLTRKGVNWREMYNESQDSIYTAFNLGMLSQALKDTEALNKLNYKTLEAYIKDGQYIPVTTKEKLLTNSLKSQVLSDIRALNGKIFQDINGILVNNSRKTQEAFIRKEIKQGLSKNKSYKEIASEIARKTGDWNRNFLRIVNYVANSAYQHGRLAFIEKTEEDVLVFKRVSKNACNHCVKAYLTKGQGSEPRLFTISQLKANGNNIGRKVDEWLPVVDSTHPNCFTNSKTPIFTSKGWKHIKDIKVGDLVLTHKGRFRRVTNLVFTERVIKEKYIIETNLKRKGRVLKLRDITGDHPVFVNGNWVKVKDIKVGQKLHLLHDNCSKDGCKNDFPVYKSDNKDTSYTDFCSFVCRRRDWYSKLSKEYKNKLTQNARKRCLELYPNYEFLTSEESRKKSAVANGKRNASYIELKLRHFLDNLNVEYQIGHMIPSLVKGKNNKQRYYYPDIYIPSLNMVIEADGENWHDKKLDDKRDREIKDSIGADTFRFKEEDIRDNGEQVFKELQRLINNHTGQYHFHHTEVTSIKKIECSNYKTKLYNFSVEEDESYIVNGLVVHNCFCTLYSKPKGYKWNPKTQMFDIRDESVTILKKQRQPIRIKISGKEFLV